MHNYAFRPTTSYSFENLPFMPFRLNWAHRQKMPRFSSAAVAAAAVATVLLVAIARAPTLADAQYYDQPAVVSADSGASGPNESYDYAGVDDLAAATALPLTANELGDNFATSAPSVVRVTGIDVIPSYNLQPESYADETPHPLDQPAPSPSSGLYGANDDDSVDVDADTTETDPITDTTADSTTDNGGDAAAATEPPAEPDYSVRTLNVSAAIFEHIAPVQFYTQRWRIQAQVQLPDFTESLDAIDRYDELVRKVCDGFVASLQKRPAKKTRKPSNKLKSNATLSDGDERTTTTTMPPPVIGADLRAHCRNAEREVTMLTNRVRTTNEELRKVTATARKSRRGKRSAEEPKPASAQSADSTARQLYLAVEEVVSDKLFDRVELLEREAQWGFRLMKNELGVLRGTNNAVYKTVWKLTDVQKENDANIKRMVRKLRTLRGAVSREADEVQARLTLVELVQLISLELTGLVEQQNEVLSLVTTSAAGRLHPMVMGASELNRFYTNMSQQMGLSEVLVDGDEDLVPKMVSIRSAQDGRNVEVRIEVPMVRREEFQLYRAYALPRRAAADTARSKQPVSVVLEEEYLAVSEADGTFVPMSGEQLRECNTLGAKFDDEGVRYVCKLEGPLYTSGADSCLVSLFQQRPLDETPCELKTVPRRDTVTKMRMASTWLWLAANASTVRVSCAHRPGVEEEVLVAPQSIVQLNGMCELETHTFRLQAESTMHRNVTVLQSKEMMSGSNIAALDEFAMQQATAQPAFASHDLDQDPIRLTQPRQYHRWLNQNGRAITALTRSFRQVESARKKGKQDLAATPDGQTDYMQIILTVGQVAMRVVRLIMQLVTRFVGDADDDFFF